MSSLTCICSYAAERLQVNSLLPHRHARNAHQYGCLPPNPCGHPAQQLEHSAAPQAAWVAAAWRRSWQLQGYHPRVPAGRSQPAITVFLFQTKQAVSSVRSHVACTSAGKLYSTGLTSQLTHLPSSALAHTCRYSIHSSAAGCHTCCFIQTACRRCWAFNMSMTSCKFCTTVQDYLGLGVRASHLPDPALLAAWVQQAVTG